MHLLDRLSVIFRYRHVVVAVLVLVMVAAVVQTYTTVPQYRAAASVQIEEDRPAVPGFQNTDYYYQDPEVFKNTQYSILRSRDLARKVVRRLDLANAPQFARTGGQPTGVRALIGSIRHRVGAALGGLFRDAAPAEPPAADESAIESGLVGAYLGGVRVEPQPASQLVNVVYVHPDPQFAAIAANALAESYVEQNLQLKQANSLRTLEWLAEQIAERQAAVQGSERALAEYREQNDAISLGDNLNVVANRLNFFNAEASRAKATRVQKESLYNQIKDLKATDPTVDTFPFIAQNGNIQRIKLELQRLEQDRLEKSQRYLPAHPEMRTLDTAIADARARLQAEIGTVIESVRQEYQAALEEERRLAGQYGQAERDAQALNRKSIDYSVLENQAKTNREVFQQLLTQQQELQVASNSRTNNVRLVERAEVPAAPFTPDVTRNLLVALAVGLVLGLVLAFGLDYLDDT
ncbi:MAG TPA: GumC family protein, partial [Candidatus Limnocylindrales bacterium]|nr:GumC family protein [Candidatus Limnocylindrales bacterium]